MQVAIANIDNKGIELEETVDVSCWNLNSFDLQFNKDMYLRAHFIRAGSEIVVKAHTENKCLITCSRCLQEIEQDQINDFILSYDSQQIDSSLNIDADLRQELLLNFPMKLLCRTDCRGICPGCGVNLNKESCQCDHNHSKGGNNGSSKT
jgi:uncharacterized protein